MNPLPVARYEPLEPRRLFASSFANINVSATPGNHAEGTIVVDPRNPSRLFAASNAPGVGLLAALSFNGGATWTRRPMAGDAVGKTGLAADGLAPACCDPSAAFDRFGNLYLTYAHDADHGVEIVRSTDGGATFSSVASFAGDLDQPTVSAGPDTVWVTFKRGNSVAAAGAPTTGLGAAITFGTPQAIPGSARGNFGDIAVGAQGQVAVTYQQGAKIGVSVDPDGLGPAKFGRRIIATTTKVGGFDRIAAQPDRGIDAEAALAYDRRATPGVAGRLYLLYTDEQPDGSDNTDIMLRYSPDGGVTWSAPARVNSDAGLSSQFLPRMTLDDTTGDLYFAWLDTRNDLGAGGSDDTNRIPNDDAETFVNRVRPSSEGLLIGDDVQVSQSASNAETSDSSIELGDYIGVAFDGTNVLPLWADNSNSTGDNPDGAGAAFDQYTARVPAASLPTSSRLAQPNLPGGYQAIFSTPKGAIPAGRADYRFRVTYSAPAGIDPASLSDEDFTVAGPNGVIGDVGTLRLESVRSLRKGNRVVGTYVLDAPLGRWTSADNGTYTITLRQSEVKDVNGEFQPMGEIGTFVVRSSIRPAT